MTSFCGYDSWEEFKAYYEAEENRRAEKELGMPLNEWFIYAAHKTMIRKLIEELKNDRAVISNSRHL